MPKRKKRGRLFNTPVILPLLNVVLIVQVFFMATTYSFRPLESVKVSLPEQTASSCHGSWVYNWTVLFDTDGQWWLREAYGEAQKMSPAEIAHFIDIHESRSILFEIDQDTPYFILESIFAHLSSKTDVSSISLATKVP